MFYADNLKAQPPIKRVRLELDSRHLGYDSIEELCDHLTEPFPEFAHCPSVNRAPPTALRI